MDWLDLLAVQRTLKSLDDYGGYDDGDCDGYAQRKNDVPARLPRLFPVLRRLCSFPSPTYVLLIFLTGA